MGNIADELKRYFENTPKEQLDKDWEELKVWNDIGATCDEYFDWLKKIDVYHKKDEGNIS